MRGIFAGSLQRGEKSACFVVVRPYIYFCKDPTSLPLLFVESAFAVCWPLLFLVSFLFSPCAGEVLCCNAMYFVSVGL